MNLKYYLHNFLPGLIIFGITVYILRDKPRTGLIQNLFVLATGCGLMFPFAKRCIEHIVLRYTRPEQWTTGLWGETSAKSGIYAMYYMLIFAIAIPLGTGYVIYMTLSKKAGRKGI